MRSARLITIVVATSGILLAAAAPAHAQSDDEWRFNIAPYLWLPSVSTDFSIGDVPLEVDANSSPADLFDKLDCAMLFCGEVAKGRLGFVYDFQYLRLRTDGTGGPTGARPYDADLTFGDTTLALQYRLIVEDVADVNPFSLDALVGARAIYAKNAIELGPLGPLAGTSGEDDRVWVDPIVGVKANWRLGRHWSLFGYADIGGFGVSSDFTCQLMAAVGYHFNRNVALVGGYRYFMVDYDHDNFALDAQFYGPMVGLSFSF